MERASRPIFISGGMAAWLIIVTASAVFAQNYSGMVPLQPAPSLSNHLDKDTESFSDVSLIQAGQAENVSLRNSLRIQDFNEDSSNYTLGKEDVIEITVLRHPEVSGNFIINNEGKIQYQFIGDVKVEGLKKDELKELLAERLSEYIIAPDVTIRIIGYNSKIVYVIGEVGNPGKIYMRGDTITVREALVQAGLPLLSAKTAQTRLITPSGSGKPDRKIVNVYKLLFEGDLRENLVMKPGDTLYVPPTIMAKAMRVISPVTQPINAAGRTGRNIYTGGF